MRFKESRKCNLILVINGQFLKFYHTNILIIFHTKKKKAYSYISTNRFLIIRQNCLLLLNFKNIISIIDVIRHRSYFNSQLHTFTSYPLYPVKDIQRLCRRPYHIFVKLRCLTTDFIIIYHTLHSVSTDCHNTWVILWEDTNLWCFYKNKKTFLEKQLQHLESKNLNKINRAGGALAKLQEKLRIIDFIICNKWWCIFK